jgi:hypothetical protein
MHNVGYTIRPRHSTRQHQPSLLRMLGRPHLARLLLSAQDSTAWPCKPPRRAHQQWRQPWERELFVCHSVGVPFTASLRPGISHASRPTSSRFVGEFIFQKIHAPGIRICAAASPASLKVQGPEPPRSPHPLDRDRPQPGESYL